jgi:hypothetical protein
VPVHGMRGVPVRHRSVKVVECNSLVDAVVQSSNRHLPPTHNSG